MKNTYFKKCTCSCREIIKNGGMSKHIVACCNNGLVQVENVTAEDLLYSNYEGKSVWSDLNTSKGDVYYEDDVKNAMQEYAKLKCQELLDIVVEQVTVKTKYKGLLNNSIFIDKDSILNAVDLESFCK